MDGQQKKDLLSISAHLINIMQQCEEYGSELQRWEDPNYMSDWKKAAKLHRAATVSALAILDIIKKYQKDLQQHATSPSTNI